MDSTILVADLVEEGSRITEQLLQNGFDVTTAFWLQKAEDGEWYFYIVSPLAEPGQMFEAYRRFHTMVRQMPGPHWIHPLIITLLPPSHPIARDVLAIQESNPGLKTNPLVWDGNILGDVSIDRAYLYPQPALAGS